MLSFKTLKAVFKPFCILIAVILIIWQIYTYQYSPVDLLQVDFRRFHSNEYRIYPALTLCFDNTDPSKHSEPTQDNLLNDGSYQDDPICPTVQIEDCITNITIKDFRNEIIRYSQNGTNSADEAKVEKISTSFAIRQYKLVNCFAIGTPFVKHKEIKSIDFKIRKSLFMPGGNYSKRCLNINERSKTSFGLSYLNQYFPLLKYHEMQYRLKELDTTCSGFVFHVNGLEVINRRNKQNDPCNSYANENSINELEDRTNEHGCKPQTWDSHSLFPDCSEKILTEHRRIEDKRFHNSSAKRLAEPCRYIQNLWHRYDLDTACNDENDTFSITIIYNNRPFKEISFVPAHTLSNMLMNVMAIIGFVLGFSLCNAPDMAVKLLDRWNLRLRRYKLMVSTYDGINVQDGSAEDATPLIAMEEGYVSDENEEELFFDALPYVFNAAAAN